MRDLSKNDIDYQSTKMEMNGEKALFISLWRKGVLIFLQRQQSLVLGQSGLIQWSDSLKKRLKKIYLGTMAHRIEINPLLWDYALVLRLPIIFRDPFLYTIPQERRVIVSFSHTGRMLVVNHNSIRSKQPYQTNALSAVDRDVLYQRADSGMMRNRTALGPGELVSNMDHIKREQMPNYFREAEKIDSSKVLENPLLKPEKLNQNPLLKVEKPNLRYEYKGKSTGRVGRMGRSYFAHTGWMPVVNLNTIRSMKPYQKMALRTAFGEVKYEIADSGTTESLISDSGEFGPNMEQLYRDQTSSYFLGGNDQDYSEISENLPLRPENLYLKDKGNKNKGRFKVRTGRVSLILGRQKLMVNQDKIRFIKPYKKAVPNQRAVLNSLHGDLIHEDMTNDRVNSGMERGLDSGPGEFESGPIVPIRQERADSAQADTIYAIPTWTQSKTKRFGGRFDSILTSDKIQGYSRSVSLNTEGGMSLYEMAQTQNPVREKKESGKTGASIDYNKVADRVYEILTRRIIREKERLGELI